jgi:hypothetical protein
MRNANFIKEIAEPGNSSLTQKKKKKKPQPINQSIKQTNKKPSSKRKSTNACQFCLKFAKEALRIFL